ncbi:cathepsin K-like [Gadus chalcogrammus]|uniref:cathepsin K-like n=1 Tax=Gadus chalcogrammus TaxID=1042646 RepID=UPI0024C4A25A|nr:cathepsin K-like [Gadus chalcogrammus]
MLLASLCLTAAAMFDTEFDLPWAMWKRTYNKNYETQVEEVGRRELWEFNLKMISVHNLEASMGRHTYRLSMNHLGDRTREERHRLLARMHIPSDHQRRTRPSREQPAILCQIAWTGGDKGYVTKVKDQRDWGNTWPEAEEPFIKEQEDWHSGKTREREGSGEALGVREQARGSREGP